MKGTTTLEPFFFKEKENQHGVRGVLKIIMLVLNSYFWCFVWLFFDINDVGHGSSHRVVFSDFHQLASGA